MKKSKLFFISAMSISFLCGCSQGRTYTLTFYQDEGNKTDKMTFVVGKTTKQDIINFQNQITVNPRVGYDTVWQDVDVSTLAGDYLVLMKYRIHDYTISFVNDGVEVGKTTYNIKTKELVQPEFDITDGYTYSYEPFNFRNRHEDLVIETTKVECEYKVTFKKSEDDISPIIRYYSKSVPQVITPEGQKGYTSTWLSGSMQIEAGKAINFSGALRDYTFIGNLTPNKYTITYDPNGGSLDTLTQEVTFDSPYELKTAVSSVSLDNVGWNDEDNKDVPVSGIWNIDEDVTLKAKWGFSFEGDNVPSVFTSLNRTTLSIHEGDATHGEKSLKLAINDSGVGNYQVALAKSTLETLFADPEVVAVNFDAKSDHDNSNFRSYHTEGTAKAWTYENNNIGYGLTTEWKTFTFKREYLNGYVDMFEGYDTSEHYVLIDNIRAVKEHLTGLGFESGCLSGLEFKDGGHADANPAPIRVFNVLFNPTSLNKGIGFDYSIKTEGNRSFFIKKDSGYIALYISETLKNMISDDGYLSFDLYSTINIGSSPESKQLVDGRSTGDLPGCAEPFGESGYQHVANKWATYKVSKDKMTADGRFAQITCGSGTLYIDNLIIK